MELHFLCDFDCILYKIDSLTGFVKLSVSFQRYEYNCCSSYFSAGKHEYWMKRSRLDGDGMGLGLLGQSLVNCRQMATIWPLCPTYERAKNGIQLIFFHLHEDGTKHV